MTPSDLLRAKLNLETARLAWPELERHFARGVVVHVRPGSDLVEVALAMAENRVPQIETWLADGTLARPDMDDAQRWHDAQQVFWGVVVAPFVLVQEIDGNSPASV
ncbi:MAG: DUF2288 domain-containing protein [Thiobacillus sp.]